MQFKLGIAKIQTLNPETLDADVINSYRFKHTYHKRCYVI